MRKVMVAIVCLAAVAMLAGCNMFSLDDGVLTIDINISEQSINNIIAQAMRENVDRGEDILFDPVTNVEMIEPNIMRIYGTADVNGQRVDGSYDLQIGAESGALKLAVTAVDVPGVTLEDPRLVRGNKVLSDAFTDQVTTEGGRGPIQSVTIEDGGLHLTIAAPLN